MTCGISCLSFHATALAARKLLAFGLLRRPTSYNPSQRLAELFQSSTLKRYERSWFDLTELCTASITNGSSLKSRDCGMEREALPSSEINLSCFRLLSMSHRHACLASVACFTLRSFI